ncbi:MAG TPA: response regulator [Gemmatimonadales bacterium]|nr:response regulator [Gemmatimonadales bacterium]
MSRYLVVDDKPENLYYLQALLSAVGHTVELAHHGAEALVRARNAPPDLVVSDLLMPVMDGYTLLRHWKADPRLARIPFVVYTATYTEPEDERLALSLGADAFILKPAEPEDFLARLQAVEQGVLAAGAPRTPRALEEEPDLLKIYSQTLVRKLEEKTLQLEAANQTLQQDVEERRRLAESRAAVLDALPAQIALVDGAGIILAVNESWRRFAAANAMADPGFGVGRDYLAVCDRAFGDCAEEAHAVAQGIRRVLSGELPQFALEYPCHSPAEKRWFRLMVSPLRAGTAAGAVVMHVNVTEQKTMEAQFLRAQRMESLGTLAGGIAHDLNNVLTPILMSIDLLKDEESAEARREMLTTIEGSATKGAEMVRQLLSFARGVEGRRVVVDVAAIVYEVAKIANDTFLKTIQVRTAVASELPPVIGDPTQLHQVLLNLCVNARDAMPAGGTLALSAEVREVDAALAASDPGATPGRFVVVTVADSGAGMPAATIDRIFEPFFTTKEHGRGTGLGLSSSLAIVRSHQGFFRVWSTPGQGSTFEVYLPAQADAAHPAAGAAPRAAPRGQGQLVLVVDDEAPVRDITRRTLEANGYRVALAADGREGVERFRTLLGQVALVITDMMMPVMDGPATIRALRGIDPAIPVLATSGLADPPVKPGEDPLLRHLGKPYTAEQLLTEVAALVRKG